MLVLDKLQKQGWKWLFRRIVREFIQPTTRLGRYFKPVFPLLYYLTSKPINFLRASHHCAKELSNDTLYFFYDFDVEPITYDFIWAMVVANARREELGLKFLTVVFVPGTVHGLRQELPEYERYLSHETRKWRIYSILMPSIKLLSCFHSTVICATREEAIQLREKQARFVYPINYNVTFPVSYAPEQAVVYRKKCLSLRADPKAMDYVKTYLQQAGNRKVVVVTLRQYGYTPERNSNMSAWVEFANKIDTEKFFIVFVPDVDDALNNRSEALKGHYFFDAACWNLNLRAALYELAYLNLGVNTGPMSLCWFNPRCRYITFKVAVKNVPQVPLTMLTNRGFIPGESPAFANSFQKWVWEEDDFDVIHKEFQAMCESIERGLNDE